MEAREFQLVALVAALLTLTTPTQLSAEESNPEEASGLRLHSALGLRAVPVGLTLGNDLGYRWRLFDSEAKLLDGTWLETGATTEITPSNGWFGAYVEAVPLAVLKLRASFQSVHYFGTYGYLYLPDGRDDGDWAIDVIDDDFENGTPSRGWMATLSATPRIKLGSFVALAETTYRWVDMSVASAYYESTFDMLLEPTDAYWKTTPTAGWVFEFGAPGGWLLAGLGWEHTETFGLGLSRDMVRALALWGLPWKIAGGEAELAVLGGFWVDHPNRANTGYLAGQFSVDWSL